jgi:hypothetical protein
MVKNHSVSMSRLQYFPDSKSKTKSKIAGTIDESAIFAAELIKRPETKQFLILWQETEHSQ